MFFGRRVFVFFNILEHPSIFSMCTFYTPKESYLRKSVERVHRTPQGRPLQVRPWVFTSSITMYLCHLSNLQKLTCLGAQRVQVKQKAEVLAVADLRMKKQIGVLQSLKVNLQVVLVSSFPSLTLLPCSQLITSIT